MKFLGYENFSGHTYESGGAFPCLILPGRTKEFFYDTSFGHEYADFWDHLWSQAAQSNAAAYQQNPLSWYGAFKGNGTQDFKNTTNFPSPAYGDGANRRAVGNFNFGASVAAAGMPLSTGQFWAGAGALVSNLGAQANFSMSQAGYMNGQYGGPAAPSPLPQAPPWTMGPGFPGSPVMGPDGVMNQGDQTWPTESRAVATGFLWQSLGCTQ